MLILTQSSDAHNAASGLASSTKFHGTTVAHVLSTKLALFLAEERQKKQPARTKYDRQVDNVLGKIVVGASRRMKDAIT
jgi:hypothetical protein